MGEREKPPLILGRPFLKTVGATIDVGKGEIKFDTNQRSCHSSRQRNKIKEVVAFVRTKEQKSPVKTKQMTKLENKPVHKMVRKWVPKIAMPAKSIDPK
jgi:hypothetical protein